MEHNKWFVRVGLVIAAIAVVAFGAWIVTNRPARTTNAHVAELAESEVTARALEIAHTDYVGAPKNIQVLRTTMGAAQIVGCNPLSGWLAGMIDKFQGKLDWCDAETTVWVITLRGDFQQRNFVTDSLSIALDGTGKFIRLDSGTLLAKSDSD